MEDFDLWRRKHDAKENMLPPAPPQTGYREVEHNGITLLKRLNTDSQYDVLRDERLRKVTFGLHKHRLCLVIHSLSHIAKGLRRVRFLDKVGNSKEATLHDLELCPLRT